MKKENVIIKQSCHSRNLLSGMTNKNNCHAEEFLLSIPTTGKEQGRDPEQKPFRMTSLKSMTCGFTLIELLVVVLIIGILAAVALPQYQQVVRKSRAVQLLHVVDHISKIRTLHLLAGGSNADGLLNMGFSLSYTSTYTHNTVLGIIGPYYNIQYYSTDDYYGVYDGRNSIPIWFAGGSTKDNSWYCKPMGSGGDELCKSITGSEKIGGQYLLKR